MIRPFKDKVDLLDEAEVGASAEDEARGRLGLLQRPREQCPCSQGHLVYEKQPPRKTLQ